MAYPTVTALYAGIFGLLFVALSIWVVAGRVKGRVHHGDGGKDFLNRRIRAHGNFAEYVPLALLMSALLEMRGAPPHAMHMILGLLLIARCAHPVGMLMPPGSRSQYALRGTSITLTWLVLAGLALHLLAEHHG